MVEEDGVGRVKNFPVKAEFCFERARIRSTRQFSFFNDQVLRVRFEFFFLMSNVI